uniref:Uncharacterized protein n=1 Tax=viral metagenome TaxID=1070528 RepID=A0A6C0BP79_9ZZZZ
MSYSQVHQYCSWPDSGLNALSLNTPILMVGRPMYLQRPWWQPYPDSGLRHLQFRRWNCPKFKTNH